MIRFIQIKPHSKALQLVCQTKQVVLQPQRCPLLSPLRKASSYQSSRSTTRSKLGQNFLFYTGSGIGISLVVTGIGLLWTGKRHGVMAYELDDDEEKTSKPWHRGQDDKLANAITKSRLLIERLKEEVGIPGVVVGVSVNGQEVWTEGFGYSDLENRVPCTADTVLRIASISKSITMTTVAKLLEDGLLDLDAPIQTYLPSFPEKTFENKKGVTSQGQSNVGGFKFVLTTDCVLTQDATILDENWFSKPSEKLAAAIVSNGCFVPVEITLRQLVSHLSGVRHYYKFKQKETNGKDTNPPAGNQINPDPPACEFDLNEYLIKDAFASVADSLKLFQDDPLMCEPGKEYLYTTHGFTLISAVVEAVAGQPFTEVLLKLFKDLNMTHTFLDENEPLIYNRARYYNKNKKGRLVNEPYVDLSYKWGGGGLLSTAGDLLRFANVMLYSFQYKRLKPSDGDTDIQQLEAKLLRGYLKPETVSLIWRPVDNTKCGWAKEGKYGMGWGVVSAKQEYGFCQDQRFYVTHAGGAIGASSILIILPAKRVKPGFAPQGVSVAIIVNMRGVGLNGTALEIAKLFEEVEV